MEANDYVSYPLALKLKECGFDWECDKNHVERIPGTEREEWDDEECQYCTVSDITYTPIPTLYAAQKWLREKKEIIVLVEYEKSAVFLPPYKYVIYNIEPYGIQCSLFDSYQSALSAGIESALELIKEKET